MIQRPLDRLEQFGRVGAFFEARLHVLGARLALVIRSFSTRKADAFVAVWTIHRYQYPFPLE